VNRKWIKGGVFLVSVSALLFWGYVSSFQHSHFQPTSAIFNRPTLVVCGLPFPYTPSTAQIFCAFYRPLIERAAAAQPSKLIEGPILYPMGDRTRIIIGTGPNEGIGLHVPPTLWWQVNAFAQDKRVAAIYRPVPLSGSPFCCTYQLVSISGINE
jgi:hypothetical protein